jgi:hypothetical protein
MTFPEFQGFPKIERLSRDIIITEKIDGTNAQIYIDDWGEIFAGSRNRWVTPQDDNYGFARWVEGNKTELLKLGEGRHFGEWWGQGIQRGYGLKEKRFSLFNVARWIPEEVVPEGVFTVPMLYTGEFDTSAINRALMVLRSEGSMAAEGFMDPEGIVVYHTAGNVGFKKTIENDDQPKSFIQS